MKKLTHIALTLCIGFLCTCNKNNPPFPDEPQPLLNRLDSIIDPQKPFLPMRMFFYDANDRFKSVPEPFNINNIYGTTYSYNSEGLVDKIRKTVEIAAEYVSTEISINYQNGMPVTGKLKQTPYQNKAAYPFYETDSLVYKVTNGKVTEIKHIDYKVYHYRDNKWQLNISVPGTRSIHTLTYHGNNLTRIETANAAFAKVMTYGTRKGVFSAYRLNFVLWENEDPIFSAENDLTSVIEPFNKIESPKWEKTTYAYQYNPAGYPKSSVVSRTDANGVQLETFKLKYYYK